MNLHYKTWIAQGRFTNIILTPSKQWDVCDKTTYLTHWGLLMHICVSKLTIIGSDNGLLPERRQAITWTNAGILLIRHLGTSVIEISIRIQTFFIQENALESVVCERASILSWPQCVNIAVDELMMQGAMASAAMVLSLYSHRLVLFEVCSQA